MKLFISTDFEGVAGIVDWDQIMLGSYDYEMGRRLLLGELNAAIDGAMEAGATELRRQRLAQQSCAICRPTRSWPGAAALRQAQATLHDGGAGWLLRRDLLPRLPWLHRREPGDPSHSYNPRAIWEARINGEIVGETALNALVAAHYGVPIALVTGDQVTAEEAKQLPPATLRRGQALGLALCRREPASRDGMRAHPRGRATRAHRGASRPGAHFPARPP